MGGGVWPNFPPPIPPPPPCCFQLGLHFGSKKDWISRLILENYWYFTGIFRTEVKPYFQPSNVCRQQSWFWAFFFVSNPPPPQYLTHQRTTEREAETRLPGPLLQLTRKPRILFTPTWHSASRRLINPRYVPGRDVFVFVCQPCIQLVIFVSQFFFCFFMECQIIHFMISTWTHSSSKLPSFHPPPQAVVYGDTVESLAAINGLVASGLSGEQIALIKPKPNTDVPKVCGISWHGFVCWQFIVFQYFL